MPPPQPPPNPDDGPDGECCINCKFRTPLAATLIVTSSQQPTGVCHRNPPRVIMRSTTAMTVWPETADHNWCGEFKKAKGA